jgi:hypothetical protein
MQSREKSNPWQGVAESIAHENDLDISAAPWQGLVCGSIATPGVSLLHSGL